MPKDDIKRLEKEVSNWTMFWKEVCCTGKYFTYYISSRWKKWPRSSLSRQRICAKLRRRKYLEAEPVHLPDVFLIFHNFDASDVELLRFCSHIGDNKFFFSSVCSYILLAIQDILLARASWQVLELRLWCKFHSGSHELMLWEWKLVCFVHFNLFYSTMAIVCYKYEETMAFFLAIPSLTISPSGVCYYTQNLDE